MKKYTTPTLEVIEIQCTTGILSNSGITDISNDADLKYGGGWNGYARSRESNCDDWDE